MNSLCNIYVRFLPKLRALYQQYSKIQWADDKTITALRMVGMWRFIQEKGSILDPDFRLTDADKVIAWKLESPSVKPDYIELKSEEKNESPLLRSTYAISQEYIEDFSPASFKNAPLSEAPDPFATLFLYQLFESLVRLAHHRLESQFPDSLILQVTRFLENSIFIDDAAPENEYSQFRARISEPSVDDAVTQHSPLLLDLYLDYCGFASGTSAFQARQLEQGIALDSNVDVAITEYHGLMTVRDLVLFMGRRGFFESDELTVMEVLLFVKYAGVSRAVTEEEEAEFRRFFTSFMGCQVTFVEFVQALLWAAHRLIKFDWPIVMKFEYLVEHIEQWAAPPREESDAASDEDGAEEPDQQPVEE